MFSLQLCGSIFQYSIHIKDRYSLTKRVKILRPLDTPTRTALSIVSTKLMRVGTELGRQMSDRSVCFPEAYASQLKQGKGASGEAIKHETV